MHVLFNVVFYTKMFSEYTWSLGHRMNFKPSTDALLGRMVTAPSATSSWSRIGELFAPQLSDPTNLK